jgi:hypothetical protein
MELSKVPSVDVPAYTRTCIDRCQYRAKHKESDEEQTISKVSSVENDENVSTIVPKSSGWIRN